MSYTKTREIYIEGAIESKIQVTWLLHKIHCKNSILPIFSYFFLINSHFAVVYSFILSLCNSLSNPEFKKLCPQISIKPSINIADICQTYFYIFPTRKLNETFSIISWNVMSEKGSIQLAKWYKQLSHVEYSFLQ